MSKIRSLAPQSGTFLLPFALILVGCSNPPAHARSSRVPSHPSQAHSNSPKICDPKPAQFAIGQRISEKLSARALHASGAAVVRQLRPGAAITMEYSAARLNLELNNQGKVIGVRCG